MQELDPEIVRRHCTRFLTHHYPITPKQMLSQLAEAAADSEPDHYGSGDLISGFEQNIAGLLGKEAAVFMPSGTMCQQIALRIWADRSQHSAIAFHPTCHLEL